MHSLQRLIGAGAGLLFKGSGFYLTDYKKSKTSAASSTVSSDTPANGTSSTGDSASAPASDSKNTASERNPSSAE
jgi:hypothetical protein